MNLFAYSAIASKVAQRLIFPQKPVPLKQYTSNWMILSLQNYRTIRALQTMTILKSLSYAFNSPCKEIMQIPISQNIKLEAKEWIDSCGDRPAKGLGGGCQRTIPRDDQSYIFMITFFLQP
jgi:hypothetical protein